MPHERRELMQPAGGIEPLRDTSAADSRPRSCGAGCAAAAARHRRAPSTRACAPAGGTSGWRCRCERCATPSKVNSGSWHRCRPSSVRRSSCSSSSAAIRGPCGTRRVLPNLPPLTISSSRLLSTSPEPQSARLTGAQPEPVAQREDRPIGRPAVRGMSVVRQRAGGVEQPSCLDAGQTGTGSAVRWPAGGGSRSGEAREQLLA